MPYQGRSYATFRILPSHPLFRFRFLAATYVAIPHTDAFLICGMSGRRTVTIRAVQRLRVSLSTSTRALSASLYYPKTTVLPQNICITYYENYKSFKLRAVTIPRCTSLKTNQSLPPQHLSPHKPYLLHATCARIRGTVGSMCGYQTCAQRRFPEAEP
ncbi:uncharacterized protein EV420DRAFT_986751 [Desarmillaria tabescens]|uniref:Uncharacterized protein n=1 Tax=Armillaria tabescens TaxID=1929756 RepID=A0AA39MSS0_ARMTA|nr:uncharacterized protein EV420DRAFT_986751 [Desarmillaria tabescens]KAK0444903.1 hypothetical protein EV420DRAFT_986751 [Desarmillaria tabescens]